MMWFAVSRRAALGFWLALAGAGPASAATTAWVGDSRASVRLVTGSDDVDGSPAIAAGLEFRYAPGWHGYWRTPGDAGIAPVLDWTGSENVEGATVSWPAPTRLVVEGLQNSVYTGRFILPLSLQPKDPQAATRIQLTIDYAACANICVPEHADLSLDLPVGHGVASAEAPALAAARDAVPRLPDAAGIAVQRRAIERGPNGPVLRLDLRSTDLPFDHPDVFIEGAGDGLPPAPTIELSGDRLSVMLTASLPATLPPGAPLALTIVDGSRSAWLPAPPVAATPPATDATVAARGGILAAMAIALIGGLILNLMPCVLPILSIKLFGLARTAGAGRRAVRLSLLATALGIVASFGALAAVLIALKLSGATLGWGIQFQQPWFLAVMAIVTVLFAASFFEWLPIGLPRVLAGLGALPSRGALAEAFLAGAFATLLATPCSAPFVGTAVGFALAGGLWDIAAIFLCLGLGMALPYLLAAVFPQVVGWLPRPGPWMPRLRLGLGVLLLGTAAWLLFVLASVAGPWAAAGVGVALVALLGLRAWLTHRVGAREGAWPTAATGTLAALALAAAWLPQAADPRRQQAASWQAFDTEAIDRYVGAGKTVLVDVTASWCLTCKVNDLTTLETAAVRARLDAAGTVRMRADWSRPDPRIAAYLQRFGRFGIPLDVVYGPNRASGEALPELLTTATVLHALDAAGSGSVASLHDPS